MKLGCQETPGTSPCKFVLAGNDFHSSEAKRVSSPRPEICCFFRVFRCRERTRVLASAVKEERSRESFDSPSPPPARRPRAPRVTEGKEPQEASVKARSSS